MQCHHIALPLWIMVFAGIVFFDWSDIMSKEKNKDSIFVIQKHDASHLHYDFRLESDGVLKSWALPKGPPIKNSDKRLAIPTEDHSLSYARFEGVIPPGSYGAGTVMVWDIGTFKNITKGKDGKILSIPQCIKNGRLKFLLEGKKLHGDYALIKTKSANKSFWLLLKMKDAAGSSSVKNKELSAISGRSMQQIAAENESDDEPPPGQKEIIQKKTSDYFSVLPSSMRNKLKKTKPSQTQKSIELVSPMLPSLASSVPQGGEWLYERKFDGQRCICFKQGKKIQLFSRNKKSLNDNYPDLIEVLQNQPVASCIIDGEIVAFEGDKTSFERLQKRMFLTGCDQIRQSHIKITYCIFDLLSLNGFDLCSVPLEYRKKILAKAICFIEPLRCTDFTESGGQAYFEHSCKIGWEGIVAKKTSSIYQQKRSKDWLKLKCTQDQDFVIGGYTSPRGKRIGLGGLLLGYYDLSCAARGELVEPSPGGDGQGAKLHYVGKVGTGFSDSMLQTLMNFLKPLEQKDSPFKDCGISFKGVHWVKPQLLASVSYKELTKAGKLRHPRFIGLRTDKNACDVRLETKDVDMNQSVDSRTIKVNNHTITLTHENKIMFPKDQITKEDITKHDIIEYYSKVAEFMVPHMMDRPVSMLRLPEGLKGESFYQKDIPESFPAWIKRVSVPKEGGYNRMVVCNNAATLVYLANQCCLTPHLWLSFTDKLNYPNRMIFDLDPSGKNEFSQICDAALALKKILESIGLIPFVMTTGSRGLHVVVPLIRNDDFDTVRALAHKIAEQLVATDPQHLTTEIRKNKRHGRIYVDVGRNAYAQTSVSPYAVRAKPCAPVATPLQWKELSDKKLTAQKYNIKNIFKRLNLNGDPWKDINLSVRSLKSAQTKFEKLYDKGGD